MGIKYVCAARAASDKATLVREGLGPCERAAKPAGRSLFATRLSATGRLVASFIRSPRRVSSRAPQLPRRPLRRRSERPGRARNDDDDGQFATTGILRRVNIRTTGPTAREALVPSRDPRTGTIGTCAVVTTVRFDSHSTAIRLRYDHSTTIDVCVRLLHCHPNKLCA